MSKSFYSEGLKIARFFMVLSSLSPLFVLLAIRGNNVISEIWFVSGCLILAILPTLFLFLRIKTAIKVSDKWEIVVGSWENSKDYFFIYLFVIVSPFYLGDLDTVRDLVVISFWLGLVVLCFLKSNLHCINIIFIFFNYQVFIVHSPENQNSFSGKEPLIVITPRKSLSPLSKLVVWRISNYVYLERWL